MRMAAIVKASHLNKQLLFGFIVTVLCLKTTTCETQIIGLGPADSTSKITNGYLEVTADQSTLVRVYGLNLEPEIRLSFTSSVLANNQDCDDHRETSAIQLETKELTKYTALVRLKLPVLNGGKFFLVCLKNGSKGNWIYQGNSSSIKISSVEKVIVKDPLPLWLKILFITILITLSGLFSGLNLGLMALDPTELKIVMNSGTLSEQKHAQKIQPIRERGNYLLCTLLLGNVLVNTSFTILLDGLVGNGILSVVGSTLGIVIFGEILPQSICSRHGLAVGARTMWITKFFMVMTFPLSYPISRILDCVLGNELGTIYNKKQLIEMLRVTEEFNDLEGDEMNIITGALNYGNKTVEEIMTKLQASFLISLDAVLDFKTMTLIMNSGHSRIPVHEDERYNIVGVLFVKDLAFVDPDDCTPLKTVIKFYNHRVQRVFFDTHLDKLLEQFKKEHSHMAIVERVNDSGEGDPFYEAIGIVTLEDILEEIIQYEIVDETDVYLDNQSGKIVPGKKTDFTYFIGSQEKRPKISPHLALAVYQYLSTAVDAFNEDIISKNVLKKLINQDVIVEISLQDHDGCEKIFLYKRGNMADYFVLILQGKVEVTIGQEHFVFEEGQFSAFGIPALVSSNPGITSSNPKLAFQYVPDYTVCVLADLTYLKIPRTMYRMAIRATMMEREHGSGNVSELFYGMTRTASASLVALPDGNKSSLNLESSI